MAMGAKIRIRNNRFVQRNNIDKFRDTYCSGKINYYCGKSPNIKYRDNNIFH